MPRRKTKLQSKRDRLYSYPFLRLICAKLPQTLPYISVTDALYALRGADDRARTGTSVTSRDFKSLASAYSATSAGFCILSFYGGNVNGLRFCHGFYTLTRTNLYFADANVRQKKKRPAEASLFGGTTQIRTGGEAFAELCLTTWLWCQLLYYCIKSVKKKQPFARIFFTNNGGRQLHCKVEEADKIVPHKFSV